MKISLKTSLFWGLKVIDLDASEKLVASAVMTSSIFLSIWNHFHTRQTNIGRTMSF